MKVLSVLLVFILSAASSSQTLIKMKSGKVEPALATSWKSLDKNKIEFVLDLNAEIAPGKKLSYQAVKDSLEGKLGATFKATVIQKGSSVIVSYEGDEKVFLKEVSRIKIKFGRQIEVAVNAPTSDGGVRAKTGDRAVNDDEVNAAVVAIGESDITVRILAVGKNVGIAGVIVGSKHRLKPKPQFATELGANIYFVPEKFESNAIIIRSYLQK